MTQNLLKLNLGVKPGTTDNMCLSCSYNVILRTSPSTSDSLDGPFMLLWPNHLFQRGGRLRNSYNYLWPLYSPDPTLLIKNIKWVQTWWRKRKTQ